SGRLIRSKIFLAKPLRRKANFELLNVPNWMQMAHSEPPKIEGISPARRGGDAIPTQVQVICKRSHHEMTYWRLVCLKSIGYCRLVF
ncbi:MAG: hypothetical protein MUC97_18790, partial [Bernardetiaceae bacterium]|nr:hypothetical protein [Bernardetiaceae bacterium]